MTTTSFPEITDAEIDASKSSLTQEKTIIIKPARLLRSTSLVAAMTMISRIMGFIRDIVLAQTFGAGGAFDAFIVAFKIPNFLRRLFSEGAFSQAFVPILAQYQAQQDHREVQNFINKIASSMLLFFVLLIVIVELTAPFFVFSLAPGFIKDLFRYHLSLHMFRITFPYLCLIGFSALTAAILNCYHRFAIASVSTVMLNVAMISVAWWWSPYASMPIYTLAWGVLIGGALQLLFQLPSLYHLKLIPKFQLDLKNEKVLLVLKKMLPAVFGVSVAQLSVLLDNLFSSFLPSGSISWLYYSDRITYLPLAVIGVALATVAMPVLSSQHSKGSQSAYHATLDWALSCTLLLGLPAALSLYLLAGPLVVTLIHHGAFNVKDVMMTLKSLSAYAFGLPAFMLIKIFAAAFYSKQNIRLPVKIAIAATLLNLILDCCLIMPLAHTGLALATSLAAWFNAIFLLIYLIKRKIFTFKSHWKLLACQITGANLIIGFFLIWCTPPVEEWLQWQNWECIYHLAEIIFAGFFLYIISLWLLGLKWKQLTGSFL